MLGVPSHLAKSFLSSGRDYKKKLSVSTMDALIASSSALFLATTGFTYANLVEWAGDIILLILGGGLGLVNATIGWIIAIAIVSVIIGLIYHGLKWLHIIR